MYFLGFFIGLVALFGTLGAGETTDTRIKGLEQQNPAFMEAVKANDIDALENLVAAGLDLYFKDRESGSFSAIDLYFQYWNYQGLLRLLREMGIWTEGEFEPSLQFCARMLELGGMPHPSDKLDIILGAMSLDMWDDASDQFTKLVYGFGLNDSDGHDFWRDDALFYVGNVAVAKFLVSIGADINYVRDGFYGVESPLDSAMKRHQRALRDEELSTPARLQELLDYLISIGAVSAKATEETSAVDQMSTVDQMSSECPVLKEVATPEELDWFGECKANNGVPKSSFTADFHALAKKLHADHAGDGCHAYMLCLNLASRPPKPVTKGIP